MAEHLGAHSGGAAGPQEKFSSEISRTAWMCKHAYITCELEMCAYAGTCAFACLHVRVRVCVCGCACVYACIICEES